MALKFYDSPFHVTHDKETASKMAMKMDLSIMVTRLIKETGMTQDEVAKKLNITQSRVSDLKNSKIEKFSIDAMIDMLDALGFTSKVTTQTTNKTFIEISKPLNLKVYSSALNSFIRCSATCIA